MHTIGALPRACLTFRPTMLGISWLLEPAKQPRLSTAPPRSFTAQCFLFRLCVNLSPMRTRGELIEGE